MWVGIDGFAKALEGMVTYDEITALSAVCDEVAATKALLHFRIPGCALVKGVELLILYTPLTGLVRPVWVRVRLSPEVEASTFLKVSEKLKGRDIRLNLASDEASVTVRIHDQLPRFRELIREVLEALDLKECVDLNPVYDGFTVVDSGG